MNISFRALVMILNGDRECSLLAAYRRAYGSGLLAWSKGRRTLALFLYSSLEPDELSQCSKYDDGTINIVQVLVNYNNSTFSHRVIFS